MKKIVVLLSIILVCITGCSIKKLDNNDIGKNISILLKEKTKMYNVSNEGYDYFIPKGMRFVDKNDYNAILKDSKNNSYYMYVDVISYYHGIKNDYQVNSDSHYSKVLNYNDKTGYIQIDEIDSKFFIQFVYNYTKIEAYVSKNDLTDVINNMSVILRSINYHNSIIGSLVGENALDYQEEDYSLFKADSSKESFLDVVEREETDKYKKDIEDEKIDLGD